MIGHDIFVVGYPAFDGRNRADVQQNLFDGRYGVKRLQPGELQGRVEDFEFRKAGTRRHARLLHAWGQFWIGGARSGYRREVLALHFGGLYHQKNYCVPSFELSRDDRVIATGIKFVDTPAGGGHDWDSWWARADAMEAPMSAATDAGMGSAAASAQAPSVPLRITISLGEPGATAALAAVAVEGDDGITLRAKIPSRFWKLIVSRVENGIAAYGFVLEQDLADVDFTEFVAPPEFLPAMYPITDIEGMTGLKFDS